MNELSNEEFCAIAKSSSKAGYVYVVAFGDCVKIGRTKHPKQRIMAIQTQSGRICDGHSIFQCTDYGKCERGVHRVLKEHRGIGEFFNVSLEMGSLCVQRFLDANGLNPTKEWLNKEISLQSIIEENFRILSKKILGETDIIANVDFNKNSIIIPVITTLFQGSIQGMLLQYMSNAGNRFFDDYQMDALEDYIKDDNSVHLFSLDKSEIDYVDSEICYWYCFETLQAIDKIVSEAIQIYFGKGLAYGENMVSPQNDKEVQPMYYESKFEELCKIVMN